MPLVLCRSLLTSETRRVSLSLSLLSPSPTPRFSDTEMRDWHQLGYLPNDLQIRFGDKGAMMELARLFPKEGGPPFVVPSASDLANALSVLRVWS